MSERSQRLERLFAAALDQTAEQRAGFVHDACGDDAALRRDVEELLVCEAQAAEFLESPAIEQAARAAARAELAGEGVPAIGSRVSHYEVRERLRRGGMGVVFRAVDLRLHREVALKVLPPSLLPDPELRLRFGQEARAASALNHPNIVVVHDVGEHDGLPFIAMEYVAGRRLTELLEEGPLPWSVLGALALQLARALAKAHAVGIVHRDLKPDNLMVTDDGLLKVLDFGLAKLATTGAKRVLSDVDPTGARATTPGTVMGTIGYMSPEQARGEATDSRTDQFSFGAILHELATGRPAFLRGSPAETLAAILGADPEPLDSERRAPEGLAAIVQRCLQRDHEDRFATTGELVQALERVRFDASPTPGRRLVGWAPSLSAARMVIAGLLLAAAAWGLGILPDRFRLQPSMRPAIESIAVLPLENLTGDPEHEYFVDGMTDALTSDLARIEALTVISRRSAMRYKDSDTPLSEIASALDVDALVEGAVQLSGGRVRITAKLVDPQTSRYLWTETYDRNLEHALTLQRDVARAIAREMRVTITDAESARLAASYPVDPEAYRLYLKGRFHWNKRTDESLARALEYFEESSRRDPGYALAYAGLADTYAILSGHRMPAEVAAPRVKEAAHKAIELDPSLGAPHAALGVIAFEFDWDWVTMEREFRSALELSPGYATAHQWYSYCLSQLARHDEAIAEAYRARELDPISLIVNHNVGQALQFAGQLERAEREYRKTLELDPDFPDPYQLLGDLYWRQGRQEAAIAHYQRYYELLEGEGGLPIGELTRIFREAGAKGALGRMIEHYREEAPYPSGVLIAGFYARMGDFDSAIASLERAYAERDRLIIGLLIDPNLDALRPDPRFQALVERVGLPG